VGGGRVGGAVSQGVLPREGERFGKRLEAHLRMKKKKRKRERERERCLTGERNA
jgi:hypothetical protein